MWRSVLSCWSQCHKAGLHQQISDQVSPGQLFFLPRRKHQFTSIYSHPFFSDSKSYTIIQSVQQIGLESNIFCTAFFFFLASLQSHRHEHTLTGACCKEYPFPNSLWGEKPFQGWELLQKNLSTLRVWLEGTTAPSASPCRKGHH